MTPGIRPLVAGNWKMNGVRDHLDQIRAIADGLGPDLVDRIDALICPPVTLLYVATAQDTIIAYEPVWAIGTGLTPTVADVAEAHGFIRSEMETRFAGEGAKMRLLYGGSVKPDNAAQLLAVPHVDGALIGGASLKAADFLAICRACRSLLG